MSGEFQKWITQEFPRGIPVLMLHKIVDKEYSSKHKIYMEVSRFERLLRSLVFLGFNTVTFNEIQTAFERGTALPRKPVILTFDDGYQNNLRYVVPLLQKYKMRAVIYLLADTSLTHNSWDTDTDSSEPMDVLMSTEERKALFETHCFEVGSHGFAHRDLTTMRDDEAFQEIAGSKSALEREFGTKIISFAYPYGRHNERHAQMVQSDDYAFGVGTDTYISLSQDRFRIYRPNLFPTTSIVSLWMKTRPWYGNYKAWKINR